MSDDEQNTPGTAVATREPPKLQAPADPEIERIRAAGQFLVERARERRDLDKMIQGLQWGDVAASTLSPQTRYAIAEFCEVTKANPITHLYVLGGRPYLNAQFWYDLVTQHPMFHHADEPRELSKATEQSLRDRAKLQREVAAGLEGADKSKRLARALDLEDEADRIAGDRQKWGAPPEAKAIFETTIWRFVNQAPMEKIRSGDITDLSQYLVPVRECNWAGGVQGKTDPVGNSNPALTARTRSFRRAAVRAFSAWLQPYAERISRIEEIVDAEFTIVGQDQRAAQAALPRGDEPQAVRTGGEPEAARAEGAHPLPVEGPAAREPQPEREQEQPAEEEYTEAQKKDDAAKFFATLKDAGHGGDKRKAWMVANGLGDTTKTWDRAGWQKALDAADRLLVEPVRVEVRAMAAELGVDLTLLSRELIQKSEPAFLREWNAVRARLIEIKDDV